MAAKAKSDTNRIVALRRPAVEPRPSFRQREKLELQALILNVRARGIALVVGILLIALGMCLALASMLLSKVFIGVGVLLGGVTLIRFAGSPVDFARKDGR